MAAITLFLLVIFYARLFDPRLQSPHQDTAQDLHRVRLQDPPGLALWSVPRRSRRAAATGCVCSEETGKAHCKLSADAMLPATGGGDLARSIIIGED
jgi:hypothetical protein